MKVYIAVKYYVDDTQILGTFVSYELALKHIDSQIETGNSFFHRNGENYSIIEQIIQK